MGGALTYLAGSAVTTTKVEHADWDEGNLDAAACSMQGWRRSMEDAHFMAYNKEKNIYLFGVFDGHGGSGVSRYCARRVPEVLFKNENFTNGNYDIALHETFLQVDMETQQPAVQEDLFKLHIDSKYTSLSADDRKKVEIHLSFETLLDLFLGNPDDPVNNPPDPFKVFLDEYAMPDPLDIPIPEKSTLSSPEPTPDEDGGQPRKRPRRNASTRALPRFTAEPHSPWGLIASKLRQLLVDESKDFSDWTSEFRLLIERAAGSMPAVPALLRPKSPVDWTVHSPLVSDPLAVLFEGKLAPLFHPHPDLTWVYSIHPIDLMALLNNDHLAEIEDADGRRVVRRCVSEDQGCTASVCLIDVSKSLVFCANAGDSRAILSRNGRAVPLSVDHKPSLPGERRRVMHAGGKVLGKADPRVQGDLNLSRAIGDWRHKQNADLPLELQMISPRPDITITELGKDDEYLILGCDGIWERFSSADCAAFTHREEQDIGLGKLAVQLCESTVRKPNEFPGIPIGVTIGCDNMSVIVVSLKGRFSSELTETVGPTLPVISYGAQVPEDWRPVSAQPAKRKRVRKSDI